VCAAPVAMVAPVRLCLGCASTSCRRSSVCRRDLAEHRAWRGSLLNGYVHEVLLPQAALVMQDNCRC
jgi:hypothetical protein